MPAYQFQLPGLGVVTANADTEACARHQVGESLGVDPDHLALVDKDPGAPVFEGDIRRDDSTGSGRDECWGETSYCDCSACEEDLIRVRPRHAALMALGLGVALLCILWRK